MQTAGPQRAALLWWFCIIKQRSQLLSWVKQQGPTESSRGIRAKWPGTVFGEGLGGPLELPASRAPFSPSYRRAALSEAVQPMTSLTRSRCAAREWMLGSASDESCLRHLPEDIEPSSYPVWDSVVFFFSSVKIVLRTPTFLSKRGGLISYVISLSTGKNYW